MDSQVFWISPTQLEFCERIYTWDGPCWADKKAVSRTSYLVDKGIVVAGYKYAAPWRRVVWGMLYCGRMRNYALLRP